MFGMLGSGPKALQGSGSVLAPATQLEHGRPAICDCLARWSRERPSRWGVDLEPGRGALQLLNL